MRCRRGRLQSLGRPLRLGRPPLQPADLLFRGLPLPPPRRPPPLLLLPHEQLLAEPRQGVLRLVLGDLEV